MWIVASSPLSGSMPGIRTVEATSPQRSSSVIAVVMRDRGGQALAYVYNFGG
jgi:hypothetical protein